MEIIHEIIEREWDFFQETENIGGRASCQDNKWTFSVNRESQFYAWNEECLKSYLEDLISAKENNRNLISEKYLRMMEFSMPEIYALEKGFLNEIDNETLGIIEKIADIEIEWQKEFSKKYPSLSKLGRPVEAADECAGMTSVRTYLTAELKTYSTKTCKLLYDYILSLHASGKNLTEIITEHLVKLYQYDSLEAAETAHSAMFKNIAYK